MIGTLEKLLGFNPKTMRLRTELIAGATTFLTMSYILAVNPAILASTGMDKAALFTATALSSAIATLLLAFMAKLPFAQAPSMGLNAFFAYTLCMAMGLSWQQSLEQTAAFIQQQQDYGFHVQACTGLQIAQLEPNLKHFPDLAAYAVDDGAVPLDHVIQLLLQQAIEAGVNYAAHQRVTSLIHHQNQVVGVSTTHGNYFADQVVLAGGVGNHALLHDCKIDLALTASPSILMKMSYQHRTALLNRIVSTPEMELRVCAVGQVLAAEDYIDAQAQNHPELIAQQALLSIQNNLKASHGLRLD